MLRPPRALVTGDRGFVGSHMARALRLAGWGVNTLDVKRSPEEDVRDVLRRWAAQRSTGVYFDVVVHCAAIVGGRTTIDGAPLDVAVDLSIDAETIGYCLANRPGRLIYFSSSAAYPTSLQDGKGPALLSEDMLDLSRGYIGMPDQTYGWAKVTGEVLIGYLRDADVPVTVLRPFSGYGSTQDTSYPFPAFIDRALRREHPFTVWGTGTQVRDFIHIDDIVDATMLCIEHDIDGPMNLCTGRATTFLDLARMVMGIAGHDAPISADASMPVGVSHRVGDPTLMNTVHMPRIGLEEGIARALRERAGRVATE